MVVTYAIAMMVQYLAKKEKVTAQLSSFDKFIIKTNPEVSKCQIHVED
jgi:hypothetical protein